MPKEDYGGWMRAFRGDATGVEHSFDELAKGVAENSISRRQALKLAGASLLGSALGAAGLLRFAAPAEAQKPGASSWITCNLLVSASCKLKCDSSRHSLKNCRCIKTSSGDRVCVWPCCSDRICSENKECNDGEVCLRLSCCNDGQNTCVKKCTTGPVGSQPPESCPGKPSPGVGWVGRDPDRCPEGKPGDACREDKDCCGIGNICILSVNRCRCLIGGQGDECREDKDCCGDLQCLGLRCVRPGLL